MSTRTCKNCGWSFPHSFRGTKCTMCGQPFDERICNDCKRLLPASDFMIDGLQCSDCRGKREYLRLIEYRNGLRRRSEEWIEKVRKVPKDYPTLTEAQWLDACRHFDGCARCGSSDIDSRGFFIDASLGGRYCDWNVIPLCEKCANTWNLKKDVFYYVTTRAHNKRNGEYIDNLKEIVKYLGGKLDDAIRPV